MQEANGSNTLLGRGRFFFDRFDANGNKQGARFVGECDQFEIAPSTTKKDIFSHTKAASTKLDTANVDQTHMLNIKLREFTPDNIALAILGDTVVLTQSATPVTGESLSASVNLGRSYLTLNRQISAVSVKKGVTVLVEGTDYEIEDATIGLITIMATSVTVSDGDAITVDYTPAAITAGVQITGGTESKIEGLGIYIGDNAQGPNYDAKFWRVRFNPNGVLALITDDYGEIPLQAELLDDSADHPTEPLYHLTQR